MLRQVKFTENQIRKLTPGEYRDPDYPRLYLRVHTRVRSWLLAARAPHGKLRRVKLGEWPAMRVTEAMRELVKAHGTLTATGVTPSEHKQERAKLKGRESLTLDAALTAYAEARALRAGSAEMFKRDLRLMLGEAALKRPVMSFTTQELLEAFDKRSKQSPSRAVGALRAWSAISRFAHAAYGMEHLAAPTRVLPSKRRQIAPRASRITLADVPALYKKIAALPNTTVRGGLGTQRDALLVLATTGARLREVCQAKWEDFDSKVGVLRVPPLRSKSTRAHTIWLGPKALALLRRLNAGKGEDEFIFPGGHKGKPLDRISRETFKKIGVDFTPHDFRRLFITAATDLLPTSVLKALVGHATVDVTQGYVQLGAKRMKNAAAQVERALLKGKA